MNISEVKSDNSFLSDVVTNGVAETFPHRIFGDSILICGDVRDVMPKLPPVDLVVSDPPYKLTSGGKNSRFMRGGIFDPKNYDNSGGIVECDIEWPEFMPLIFAALKDRAHCYTMANNRHVQAMLNAAEQSGFGFHNLLIWDKRTATSNRWYMKNCEFTGFFYKGNAFAVNDCSQKQLISIPQIDETLHPTEKPVALFRNYIEQSSKAGDMVLDPFIGSGTCASAALLSGRRFVGIEKSEKWFNVACARVEREIWNLKNQGKQDTLFMGVDVAS